MLFNSLIFLIFLPCVFLGYWFIKPKWRNIFLLLASYYFYFSYNPWFLLLLIGTSGLDFYLARLISDSENKTKRKTLLILSIVSNIGVLFIFKYFIFFFNSFNLLLNSDFSILNSLIIPAGLSFYTFQSISYTIDVYRNKYKADDTLINFLLYVSFFPHMVAGPIMRHHVLMPQLKVSHYFKDIDWTTFAKLTIWGFFKKMVIADNVALIVNPIFSDVGSYNSLELLVAGFLFLIQLYCDFSGYSDIATGVAKLFKIDLSLNWKRPLLSSSITGYWKRHHLSLTGWFREYVYLSLGGNRVNVTRWAFNILFVFILSGFWHGANMTFLIWGSLNGIFYLSEGLIKKRFPTLKFNKLLGWVYTTFLISVFFIAFRAENIGQLEQIYRSIFIDFDVSSGISHLIHIKGSFFFTILLFLIIILYIKELNEEFDLESKLSIYKTLLKPCFYFMMLFFIFLFGNFNANTFIYFQF